MPKITFFGGDDKVHTEEMDQKGYYGDGLSDQGATIDAIDSAGQYFNFHVARGCKREGGQWKKPALWIEYQKRFFGGDVMGPFMMSPEVAMNLFAMLLVRFASCGNVNVAKFFEFLRNEIDNMKLNIDEAVEGEKSKSDIRWQKSQYAKFDKILEFLKEEK